MHPALLVLWGILPAPEDLADATPAAPTRRRLRRVTRVRVIDMDGAAPRAER